MCLNSAASYLFQISEKKKKLKKMRIYTIYVKTFIGYYVINKQFQYKVVLKFVKGFYIVTGYICKSLQLWDIT